MIVEHETSWRVYYQRTMNQWLVLPPDGYYRDGEWIYLTNTHVTYWPTKEMAWNRARTNAKNLHTFAKLYRKDGSLQSHCNYTGVNGRTRKRT